MCAAQDSPQPRPLRGEKHPFPSRSSCASMRCLCRPNWVCFFFSAFPQFLASTSLEWRQNQFSLSWGLTAAPGFAHNRLTRLQQGRQPVSLVLLPYLAPKTAHRATQGRVFSLHNEFTPPPFRGRGWVSPVLGLLVFSRREARCFSAGKDGYFVSEGFSRQLPLATAAHNCPTRLQRGGEPASLVSFPTPPSKPHTGPHRAEFGFHRLFLPPFLIGSPASWRSKWQLTAS